MRSSLARLVPRTPLDDDEIRRLATVVWHSRGVALLDPAQVQDAYERQAIINAASRLYGKRNGQKAGA